MAVLGTVTALIINPAELLRQSRDYTRISDLQSLSKALSIYGISGASFGTTNTIYVSLPSTDSDCGGLGLPDVSPKTYRCANSANLRKTDGNGWIPVNFTQLPSGSPFGTLPIDPVNSVTNGYYYTYAVGSFELTSKMESVKYNAGGSSDVVTKDGGIGDGRLEVGSDVALTPLAIVGSQAQGGGPGGGGGGAPGAPDVTAISPASGPNTGPVSITSISGNNFRPGATVSLNKIGQSAISGTGPFTLASSHSLTNGSFDITNAATGVWDVVVDDHDGTTPVPGTSLFTVNPTLTGISPNSGYNSGSLNGITLTGTGLISSGSTIQLKKTGQVSITGTGFTGSGNSLSNGSFNLSGAAAGTWDVFIDNGNGSSATATGLFTINNPITPTTTSISPPSQPVGTSGPITLTVNGTNFNSGSVVNFAGSARTTDTTSAASGVLTISLATADMATAGNYNVTVTNTTTGGATSNAQVFTVSAAGRYWVGGTGNWSDTAHWATNSGGAAGAPVPTATDSVYFDANSFTAPGQTVTADTGTTPACKNMSWVGATNSPTFSINNSLNIYGSLTFVSAMNVTSGASASLFFQATTAGQTIDLAGKSLAPLLGVSFINGSYTAGGADTWTLSSDFNAGTGSSNTITLTSGALNTNGKNVTAYKFISNGTSIRKLTLGTSTVTLNGTGTTAPYTWDAAASLASASSGLTLSASSSTLVFNGSATYHMNGGGQTYGNINLTGTGNPQMNGSNTITNLTRVGPTTKTSNLSFNNSNTHTIGTLTLTGDSSINRLLISTNSLSGRATVNATNVALTNVDFQGINGTGSWTASPPATSIGNAQGNTGTNLISLFTTACNLKWNLTAGGTWSSVGNWIDSPALSCAGGVRVPLPQDSVVINSVTLANQTITADMPRLGADLDFSGLPSTATGFRMSASTGVTVFVTNAGGFKLSPYMLSTGGITGTSLTISSEPATTITMYNNTAVINISTILETVLGSGTLVMNDAFQNGSSLQVDRGTLNANGMAMTMGSFSFGGAGALNKAINMSSGTWTLTGTGTIWNLTNGSSGSVTSTGSTLVINNTTATAKTFIGNRGAGVSTTYNDVQFTGNGPLTFSTTDTAGNTFHDLKFAVGAGATAQTVTLPSGLTQTLTGTLVANGVSGKLVTIQSSSGTATINAAASTSTLQYLTVTNVNNTGTTLNCSSAGTCTNTNSSTGWGF